jgi:hypothetical protein
MSDFWALLWKVKPGTEDKVRELFQNYGRPDPVVKDAEGNEKGRLLATQVFMRDNTIVRVMEIDGALPDVAAHLGRQPAIQELETQLDQYLEQPRDMSDPEGARKFFMSTMMECVLARREDGGG